MQASSFWKRFIGTVDSDDLADLAGSEQIQTTHIAEAIQYGPRRQV